VVSPRHSDTEASAPLGLDPCCKVTVRLGVLSTNPAQICELSRNGIEVSHSTQWLTPPPVMVAFTLEVES
jgi:hypothetical protein